MDVIKNFLGKIIFKIEEVNVFDCLFFKDNNYEKRIILWRNLIRKKSLMDILYVLNLFGLECYICCLERLCLKFLFSYIVICRIEKIKDDFLKIL